MLALPSSPAILASDLVYQGESNPLRKMGPPDAYAQCRSNRSSQFLDSPWRRAKQARIPLSSEISASALFSQSLLLTLLRAFASLRDKTSLMGTGHAETDSLSLSRGTHLDGF